MAGGVKLFNHNTGKWEFHDDNSVDEAVKTGMITFHKDNEVPVVSPEGELGTIAPELAHEYFNRGYRWQTDIDRKAWESGNLEAIKEKNFGNQTGAAAAMGALDTATFGASSLGMRAAEEVGLAPKGLTEAAKEVKNRNTGAYVAGAIGGALIPGAAAGIAGLGTKAATAAGIELGALSGAAEAGSAAGLVEKAVTLPQQVSKLGAAAEAATQSAISPLTSQITNTLARTAAEQTAKKIAGGIVEGAAYGLGSGISEASLGRPDDVVDTLISHTGFGALTGGAFGAIIGGAPVAGSALKDLGGVALTGVRSAVEEAARKGLRNAAVASARSKGISEDLINVLRESFNDEGAVKAAMELHKAGKIDEFNKFVMDTEKQLRVATKKEQKDLERALTTSLKASTDENKQYIRDVIKESGNDMHAALGAIETDVKTAYAHFDDALAKSDSFAGKARTSIPDRESTAALIESHVPTFTGAEVKGTLASAAKQLRAPDLTAAEESFVLGRVKKALSDGYEDIPRSSAREAILGAVEPMTVKITPPELLKSWGAKIDALANSTDEALSAVGQKMRAGFDALKSAGSEAESFAALRALKQDASDAAVNGGFKGKDFAKIGSLNNDLIGYLRGHPNKDLASQLLSADTYYHNFLVLKKGLVNEGGIKRGAVSRLFNDPTAGERIKPALDKFSEFVPEIENVVKNFSNVKARAAAFDAMSREMNSRLKLSDTGKLTASDLESLFNIIGMDKKAAVNIDKLKTTTKLLQETADMTVPDRLVALARASGNTAAVERVQSMLPHSSIMEKIAQLKAAGKVDASTTQNAVSDMMSYAIAGPMGPVLSKTIQTAKGIIRSPWTAHETFKAIQGISNSGAKLLGTVGSYITDAVTGSTTRLAKASLPPTIMAHTSSDDSRTEKIKKFNQISSTLSQAASPEALTKTIEANLGHVSDIPNIKSSIVTKMSNAAQYLQSKMPVDPTAQYSIGGASPNWEPSDQQLNSFLNRVEAVNNPLKSMAKVADGTITPEEVEAVQTVYPSLFNGLREKVISGIIEAKGDIPYQSKLLINSVFGIPADYTTNPQFISSMQQTFAPVDKGGRPETEETKKKKLTINPLDSLTETARISYGRK